MRKDYLKALLPDFLRYLVCILVLALMLGSCREQREILSDTGFTLRFSQDTVLFDTLFTEIRSITKRFRVYNDDANAKRISSIRVAGGSSPFRILLNGVSSADFTDEIILGGDSLQILVEANIDAGNLNNPFLVTDSILFDTGSGTQNIKLVAWGQDANYLKDSVLICNTTWTSEKPYVLLGSILIDSLCTLSVDAGTRIYSSFGSSVFVGGTLEVNGNFENRVLFRNDRLDDSFNDAPGQWNGIFFLEGSKDNVISNSRIENARYGIWLGTPDTDTIPDLRIENSIIHNMSQTGVIAFTSDLTMENSLIYNCGEQAVANLAGGNYRYNHCTLGGYSNRFIREAPLFIASDNLLLADNTSIIEPVSLQLQNTIVFGELTDELLLDNSGGASFEALVTSSLLRTTLDLNVNGNIINMDPQFISIDDFNYRLDGSSPAVDSGELSELLFDLEGNQRDALPDMGAYEFQQQ